MNQVCGTPGYAAIRGMILKVGIWWLWKNERVRLYLQPPDKKCGLYFYAARFQ